MISPYTFAYPDQNYRYSPMLSSRNVNVLFFTSRSTVHLELMCVCAVM